jgi:hypothetical protein
MNKEKKQQIILIVLIPVFLAILIYTRMQKGPGQMSVNGMAQEELITPDASIDAIPGPKTDFSSEYTFVKEDPFKNLLELRLYQMRKAKPVEKSALPIPKLTIEGIIWNTYMPQAIVNGQVVRIGDTVSGVKIAKIEKQGITIDYNGETVLIKR